MALLGPYEISLLLGCFLLLGAYRAYRAMVARCPIRGLPGPRPASWLMGNLGQIYDPSLGMSFHLDLLKKYGSSVKVFGMLGDEQVYFTDPVALQQIMLKDQHIFEEAAPFRLSNGLLFGTNLLSTLGDQHKRQRKIMNPVFSNAHIKALTPIFYDITHQLCDLLGKGIQKASRGSPSKGGQLNAIEYVSRAALEMIGQCGIGYTFNALDEDSSKIDGYGRIVRNLIPTVFNLQLEFILLPIVTMLGPSSFRRKLLDFYPRKPARDLKAMSYAMYNKSKQILEEKKKDLGNPFLERKKIGRGIDIMTCLLKENNAAHSEDRLPDNEILGQMSLLIFAGSDTTSSATARILHLLSQRPEVQERLRREVVEARDRHETEHGPGDRDLSFEELMALPWLDAIIRETLRMYPPVPFLTRTCRKDTAVALSRPAILNDGTSVSSIPIAENQNVFIGIVTANHDPFVWGDDAHEWKPERWLAAGKSDREKDSHSDVDEYTLGTRVPKQAAQAKLPGVYSGMLTFMGGGRSCIGFKFSLLEMKIFLSLLLENFKFELPEVEITWKLGNIQTPHIKGREDEPPTLPLRITPLSSDI